MLPPYASSFEVMPFSILLIYMNEYYMNNIYEWTAIHSLHFFTRNSVFNKQLPSNSIKINFPFAPLYSISFFSSALCLSMSSFSININVVNKYLDCSFYYLRCFLNIESVCYCSSPGYWNLNQIHSLYKWLS